MERFAASIPNLLKQLGYNSVKFIDRVSVRLPTIQEFEVLELPDDIPVHRTFRTYYTAEGVPFEVTVMIQGGHLYGSQYRQPTRQARLPSERAEDEAHEVSKSLLCSSRAHLRCGGATGARVRVGGYRADTGWLSPGLHPIPAGSRPPVKRIHAPSTRNAGRSL